MTPERLFLITNALVLPGWLLLWFVPDARVTRLLVYSYLYPIILALGYLTLLVVGIMQYGDMPDFSSMAAVMELMESPWAFVAGWVHYLTFDLFVGVWISRNALEHSISKWVVFPSKLFTFMAGPFGLFIYLTIRWFYTRNLKLS